MEILIKYVMRFVMADHFRILTGWDHSDLQVDFRCSGF